MRGGARLIFINMPARHSAHRAFVAISDRVRYYRRSALHPNLGSADRIVRILVGLLCSACCELAAATSAGLA